MQQANKPLNQLNNSTKALVNKANQLNNTMNNQVNNLNKAINNMANNSNQLKNTIMNNNNSVPNNIFNPVQSFDQLSLCSKIIWLIPVIVGAFQLISTIVNLYKRFILHQPSDIETLQFQNKELKQEIEKLKESSL